MVFSLDTMGSNPLSFGGVEEPGSIRGKRPSNQIRAENGFVYINIQILDFRVDSTV